MLQYDVKAISRKFFGHEVCLPERSLSQPKPRCVCIRSIHQSNRSISVRLLFQLCSPVSFQGHTKIALTVGQIRFHVSVVERSKKSASTATVMIVEIIVTTHHYFITSRITVFSSTFIATTPPLDSQGVVFFKPLCFFNDVTVAFPLKEWPFLY